MVLDSEIRLTLTRIENALQNVMELNDFRNFMLAKSYLEEGQVATAMHFLERIDRNSNLNAQKVIIKSLFIRALILVYNLQFTDALALLIRIKKMPFKIDDSINKDIENVIKDIKIQQKASAIYDKTEGKKEIIDFKQNTLIQLENYLNSARELVRK